MNGRGGNGRSLPGGRERHRDREDPEDRDRRERERERERHSRHDSDQLGVGQSGYFSGRYGEDRSIDQGRNLGYRSPSEERAHGGLGVDDRFTGRGGQDYWRYDDRAAWGPYRGKGPKNFARSDDRLRELACEALYEDGDVDATDIEVEVRGGEITLRGTTPDRRMKRLAEDCVTRIPGVHDIQNQLRVAGNVRQPESRGNQNAPAPVTANETDKKHRA